MNEKTPSADAERMRIDSSGYHGIGTPSPDHKLEIKSDDVWIIETTGNVGLGPGPANHVIDVEVIGE